MLIDNLELQLELNLDKAYKQIDVLQNTLIKLRTTPLATTLSAKTLQLSTIEKDYYQQSILFTRSLLSESRKQTSLLNEIASYYRTAINVVVLGKGNYDSDEYGLPVAPSPTAPKSPSSEFSVKIDNSTNYKSLEQRLAAANNRLESLLSKQYIRVSTLSSQFSTQLIQSRQQAAQARSDRNKAINAATRDTDRLIRSVVSLKPNRIISTGLSLAALPFKLAYGSLVSILQAGLQTSFQVGVESFQRALLGTELGDRLENIFNIFADNFGQNLESGLANFARYVGGYGKRNPSELMARDLGKNLGSLLDISKLDKVITEFRKTVIRSYVDNEASPTRNLDIAKELAGGLFRLMPQQFKAMANIVYQGIATPFRVQNEIQTARFAKQIKDVVGDGNNLKSFAILKKFGLQNEIASQVLFSVAGFQREKGYKGGQTGDMLAPFVKEGTKIIGIRNRDTDRVTEKEVKSQAVDFFKSILHNLDVKNIDVSTFEREIHNIEVSFLKAFKGYDRDAVSMATVAHIIKTLAPDTDLAAVGFSGGSATVLEAVKIIEALGHQIKGVGLGGNPINAVNQSDNFTAILGRGDEQSSFFDKTQLFETRDSLRTPLVFLARNNKSILDILTKISKYAIFNVPDSIKLTNVADHSVQQYVGDEESFNILTDKLKGFFIEGIGEKSIGQVVQIPELEIEVQQYVSELDEAFTAIKEAANKFKLVEEIKVKELADGSIYEEKSFNRIPEDPKNLTSSNEVKKLIDTLIKDIEEDNKILQKKKKELAEAENVLKVSTDEREKKKAQNTIDFYKDKIKPINLEDKKQSYIRQKTREVYNKLEGQELLDYAKQVFPNFEKAIDRSKVAVLAKQAFMIDSKMFSRDMEALLKRISLLDKAERFNLADLEAQKAAIDPFDDTKQEEAKSLDKKINQERIYLREEKLLSGAIGNLLEGINNINTSLAQNSALSLDTNNTNLSPEKILELSKIQMTAILGKISPSLVNGSVEKVLLWFSKYNKKTVPLLDKLATTEQGQKALSNYISKRNKDVEVLNALLNWEAGKDVHPEEQYAMFSYDDAENRLTSKDYKAGGALAGFIDYNQLDTYEQAKELHAQNEVSDEFLEATKAYAYIAYELEAGIRHFYKTGERKLDSNFIALAKEFHSNKEYKDVLPKDFFTRLVKTLIFTTKDRKFGGGQSIDSNTISTRNKNIESRIKVEEKVVDLEELAAKINKDFRETGKILKEVNKDNIKILNQGFEGIIVADKANERIIKIAREINGVASAVKKAADESDNPLFKSIGQLPFIKDAKPSTSADFKKEAENFNLAIKKGLFNWKFLPDYNKDNQVLGTDKFMIQPLLEGNSAGSLLIKALTQLKSAIVDNNGNQKAFDINDDSFGEVQKGLIALIQTASQMSYLHSQGYDHGDLNPNNVMINRDGESTPIDFSHLKELPDINPKDLEKVQKDYIKNMMEIQKSTKSTFDKFSYLSESFKQIKNLPKEIQQNFSQISTNFKNASSTLANDAKTLIASTNMSQNDILAALLSAIDELDFGVIESIIPELTANNNLSQLERRELAPKVIAETGYLNDPRRLLELVDKLNKSYSNNNQLPNQVFDVLIKRLIDNNKTAFNDFRQKSIETIATFKQQSLDVIESIPEKFKGTQERLYNQITENTDRNDPKIIAAREKAGIKYRDAVQELRRPQQDRKDAAIDRVLHDTLEILKFNGLEVNREFIDAIFNIGYNRPELATAAPDSNEIIPLLAKTIDKYELTKPFKIRKDETKSEKIDNIIDDVFGNYDATKPKIRSRESAKIPELTVTNSLLAKIEKNTSYNCCDELIKVLEKIENCIFSVKNTKECERVKQDTYIDPWAEVKTDNKLEKEANTLQATKGEEKVQKDINEEIIFIGTDKLVKNINKTLRTETALHNERAVYNAANKFSMVLANAYRFIDEKTLPLQAKFSLLYNDAKEYEQNLFQSTNAFTANWGAPTLGLVKKLGNGFLINNSLNSLGILGDLRHGTYDIGGDVLSKGFDTLTDVAAKVDTGNIVIDKALDVFNGSASDVIGDKLGHTIVKVAGDGTTGAIAQGAIGHADRQLTRIASLQAKDPVLQKMQEALVVWMRDNQRKIIQTNNYGTIAQAKSLLEIEIELKDAFREALKGKDLAKIGNNPSLRDFNRVYTIDERGENGENDIYIKKRISTQLNTLDKVFNNIRKTIAEHGALTIENNNKGVFDLAINSRTRHNRQTKEIFSSLKETDLEDISEYDEALILAVLKSQETKEEHRNKFYKILDKRSKIGKTANVTSLLSDKEIDQRKYLLGELGNQERGLLTRAQNLSKRFKEKYGREIGVNLDESLAKGVLDNANIPFKAIVEMSEGVIKEAKKTLGIASPSRIFRQIGIDILLGLSEGLASYKISNVINNYLQQLIARQEQALDNYLTKVVKLKQQAFVSFPSQVIHEITLDLVMPRNAKSIVSSISSSLFLNLSNLFDNSKSTLSNLFGVTKSIGKELVTNLISAAKYLNDQRLKTVNNINEIGETALLDFTPKFRDNLLTPDRSKPNIKDLLVNLANILYPNEEKTTKKSLQSSIEFGTVKLSTSLIYNTLLSGLLTSFSGLPPLVSLALTKGLSDVMAGMTVRLAQLTKKLTFADIGKSISNLFEALKIGFSSKENFVKLLDKTLNISLVALKTIGLDLIDDFLLLFSAISIPASEIAKGLYTLTTNLATKIVSIFKNIPNLLESLTLTSQNIVNSTLRISKSIITKINALGNTRLLNFVPFSSKIIGTKNQFDDNYNNNNIFKASFDYNKRYLTPTDSKRDKNDNFENYKSIIESELLKSVLGNTLTIGGAIATSLLAIEPIIATLFFKGIYNATAGFILRLSQNIASIKLEDIPQMFNRSLSNIKQMFSSRQGFAQQSSKIKQIIINESKLIFDDYISFYRLLFNTGKYIFKNFKIPKVSDLFNLVPKSFFDLSKSPLLKLVNLLTNIKLPSFNTITSALAKLIPNTGFITNLVKKGIIEINNFGDTRLFDFIPSLKKKFQTTKVNENLQNILDKTSTPKDRARDKTSGQQLQSYLEFNLTKLGLSTLLQTAISSSAILLGLPPLVNGIIFEGIASVTSTLILRLAQSLAAFKFSDIPIIFNKFIIRATDAFSSKEGFERQTDYLKQRLKNAATLIYTDTIDGYVMIGKTVIDGFKTVLPVIKDIIKEINLSDFFKQITTYLFNLVPKSFFDLSKSPLLKLVNQLKDIRLPSLTAIRTGLNKSVLNFGTSLASIVDDVLVSRAINKKYTKSKVTSFASSSLAKAKEELKEIQKPDIDLEIKKRQLFTLQQADNLSRLLAAKTRQREKLEALVDSKRATPNVIRTLNKVKEEQQTLSKNKLLVNAPDSSLIADLAQSIEKDEQERQEKINNLTKKIAGKQENSLQNAFSSISKLLSELGKGSLFFGILTGVVTGNYLALRPLIKAYRSLADFLSSKPNNFFSSLISNSISLGLKLRENIAHIRLFGFQLGALATIAGTFTLLGVGTVFFGKQLANAAMQAGELRKQTQAIDRIRGSKSTKEIASISEQASSLGINKTAALQQYTNFASATLGSSLESNAEKYFTSFLKASKKSGLSDQQQELALQAVQQTVSKGRLYSEELRGQLAEHLPQAIPMAAQSLGYESTRDFLEQTQSQSGISASEFIPSFTSALEIDASTQNTDNLVTASERLKASTFNMTTELSSSLERLLSLVVIGAEKLVVSFTSVGKVIVDSFVPVTSGILVNAFANLFANTALVRNSLITGLNGIGSTFQILRDNIGQLSKAFLGLIRNLATIALVASSIKIASETVDFFQGKLSAIDEETQALERLNNELERKLNLENLGNKPTEDRNNDLNSGYEGQGTGWANEITKFGNKTKLTQSVLGFLTNDEKNFDVFETIEGTGNVSSKRAGLMATTDEIALAQDIETNIPVQLNQAYAVVSELTAVKSLIKDIEATDLLLAAKQTQKDKIASKGNRAKFIETEIKPLEVKREEQASELAVRIQGIESTKKQIQSMRDSFAEKATALNYDNASGVINTLKEFDKALKFLTISGNSVATSIAKVADSLISLENTTYKEKNNLLSFTREKTRNISEKQSLNNLNNPIGDKQLSIFNAQTNLNKDKSIYTLSNTNLKKLYERIENDDIRAILKSKNLSVNSNLEQVQAKKEKVNNPKETTALNLLEEYINQRETNSQNLANYSASLSALIDAEFRLNNSYVNKTREINLIRNDIDRLATLSFNKAKRATNALNLTGRAKTVADQRDEINDVNFRLNQENRAKNKAESFLTTDKKAQSFLKQYKLNLSSSTEAVNQVLADQPLDKEEQEVAGILRDYITGLSNIDNLTTQKSTTLTTIVSSIYDFGKSLASIFNGLQDAIIAATRGLQDAKLSALTKIRSLNQQINQKLNELASVNLDINNIIAKRGLIGQSEITGLATQAIDSLNNLQKSKLTENTSLEQAQFDLDQRLLDIQTELIAAQRELADAIRQAYLNQQQNAETLGIINADGTREQPRVVYDPVIEQAKTLEALNLPNVKVIWNTPNTPIKTEITKVDNLSKPVTSNTNPNALVQQTITNGKQQQLFEKQQIELNNINQSFTQGDKAIIEAIKLIKISNSNADLNPSIIPNFTNNKNPEGYGVIEFGDGKIVNIKNGLSDRQSDILPLTPSQNLSEGTGIIEFGDGETHEIKDNKTIKTKEKAKYHINQIILPNKTDTKTTEINQQIKDIVNITKPIDIFRGEDLLNMPATDAMTTIDTLIQTQLELVKEKLSVMVDSSNEQKTAALNLYKVEEDLAKARYQLDYENAINESKNRQRSYETNIRNSANQIVQTEYENLQMLSNNPLESRGISGAILRERQGLALINKEKSDVQFKIDNRDLELNDSRTSLQILKARQKLETGDIAIETAKEIELAEKQITNIEAQLELEKSQLIILESQTFARQELLRITKENEIASYNLNRDKFRNDNIYAAAEYAATPEITGNRFDSDRLTLELAQRRELIALREREIAINNQALTDGFSESDRQVALFGSLELFKSNMQRVLDSTNTFGNIFKETFSSPINTFFQDLIVGSKSLGETVLSLAQGVVQNLAQISAQLLTNWLMTQALGGLFGIGGGGTGGLGNAAMGLIGAAFSSGGTVGSTVPQGLLEAYKTERLLGGGQPVLSILTKGEEVLSLKNGDAQLFRSLKQNGAWEELRNPSNYAHGGTVGQASYYPSIRTSSNSTNITNMYTSKYEITTQDANSFSKSRNQLDAEANNRFRRTTRFQ